MQKPVAYFVAFLIIIGLYGCAAKVTKEEDSGMPRAEKKLGLSPSATNKVVFLIDGNDSVKSGKHWELFLEDWNSSMTAATAEANIGFMKIGSEEKIPSEVATLVRVTVNDYRYMAQWARYLVGVMAGNAFMDVTVEFLELPSHKQRGTRSYKTSTSGGQGIFSAASPKQIEAVSVEIVSEIKGASARQ
ncbi:hypothetical protein AB6Q56_01910 [Dechloromonas sp. ARDL1]|uniref:hypothetical protein n=1 Tax=Dechloromonas sp. ARDL1 TaxID=3322121 RepID=UPI003DA6EB48